MSIFASYWDSIGETEDCDAYTSEVLSYQGSHVYPDTSTHKPATVGICAIPGFIWREGMPEERKDQDEQPVAPYARLSVATWTDDWGRPMIGDGGTVILTRDGVEKLRDQLSEWLALDMHPS
jgi:hypothetical protein